MGKSVSLAIFLLLLSLSVGGGEAEEPFQPPVADKPDRFNGAVGLFRVATEAKPTTVAVEKPVRFTVRITAIGKVVTSPTRPALKSNPEFTGDFYVSDDAEKHPNERTWEFFYLLQPKRADVEEIPDVLFCFFDPRFGQNATGYQTIRADAIPLKVTLPPPPDLKPLAMPESVLAVSRGEPALRRQEAWSPPGPAVLALLLLTPPLACAAWYAVWRRLYPDAARQVRHRRSRAARQALQAFHNARTLPAPQQAEHIADAVSLYLRRRLDLPAATPTPAESAAFLETVGAPDAVQKQAFALFQACDVLRFAPEPTPAAGDLGTAATDLILAVEAQTWSSHPS